jgi:signal peptidase complex subunit 3
MHSSLVRVQNVFGFFTTVAFVIAALIAATDLITPRTPTAKIAVGNIQVYVYLHSRPSF